MKSRLFRAGLVMLLAIIAMPAVAHAQFNSPNYEVNEVFIGSGGELEMCGDEFCAQSSIGGTGGTASSDNYGIIAGFDSPDQPTMSVIVSNNNVDLGVLNESSTGAASANFSVSSYLTDGYVVRIHGNPPTNAAGVNTHILAALNSPSISQPGVEQFGINLVANTTPGIGVNPVQYPDSTFAYGEAADGYDSADHYKFVNGEIIAESAVETGQTDYTMSIIANVSTATPGGRYQTILVVQAIAMF